MQFSVSSPYETIQNIKHSYFSNAITGITLNVLHLRTREEQRRITEIFLAEVLNPIWGDGGLFALPTPSRFSGYNYFSTKVCCLCFILFLYNLVLHILTKFDQFLPRGSRFMTIFPAKTRKFLKIEISKNLDYFLTKNGSCNIFY